MADMRAYYYNKSDILEPIRYQKEPLLNATGSKAVIYSRSRMWSEERKRKREVGQMADMPVYRIPYNQIKKIANFKAQIFGL